MYLSPSDIQQTRLHTLENLHAASRAWVDATQRLSELALRAARHAIDEGSRQLEELARNPSLRFDAVPVARIAAWRSESACLVGECFEIIAGAQQAMVQTAKAQVAVLDKVLMRQMDRATLMADSNGEAAIIRVRTAIHHAESRFNELADATSRGTSAIEARVRQATDVLCGEPEPADPTESIEVAPPTRSRRALRPAH